MEDFFEKIWNLLATFADPRNLRTPEVLRAKRSNSPALMWAAFIAVNLIVFTENRITDRLSLAGRFRCLSSPHRGPQRRMADPALTISLASRRSSANDRIRHRSVRRARQSSIAREVASSAATTCWAKAYYERHGGKTIIIARFIPLIRTFVPVVAGAARMEYKSFVSFNVLGGIGWIVSMICVGYMLEPLLRQIFGESFQIAKHIDKVVIVVVFLSILPLLTKGYRRWREIRAAKASS